MTNDARTTVSRRGLLQTGAVVGAGAAIAALGPAPAARAAGAPAKVGGYLWLEGDHHVHTLFSNDGKYRVRDHIRQAVANGVQWIVLTDHGNTAHSTKGSVDAIVPFIEEARKEFGSDIVIFHGLEWNIPGAEHATVFVYPQGDAVGVLTEIEDRWDARVKGTRDGTPANEALALEGIRFLDQAVASRRVKDAVMLPNHPSRQGIDSPHELRAWQDAGPRVVLGMEGAPGHQAGGLPSPHSTAGGRGLYGNSRGTYSFPGYPAESYRTWGGFDWVTATVGGVWDSMLAEGRHFVVTATSDSHNVYLDTTEVGPGSDYERDGRMVDPVYRGGVDTDENDFWPGHYSRTHVGAVRQDHTSVLDAIRAGRVWVDHGGLVDSIDARLVLERGRTIPLGGTLIGKRDRRVTVTADIMTASRPNRAGFVPELARVDVIVGRIDGPAADRDAMTAPATRVVAQLPVGKLTAIPGGYRLSQEITVPGDRFYVRLRGTDGKRQQPGFLGAAIDPAGPAIDVLGDADPWEDLWFYTSPLYAELS
ncbi:PHP domain-containing protein [Clavibacter michiganensis]|uniref:PHP domain-containing protein n=1 Tax=Clavibacter michiganensis TaxID=28447 RepID=UPI0013667B56|nr:PHP domain-containing protein [Clavibacter michiganensis]MWJ13868.1 histidinol-phosphatase [Clavibacter michiganensis subsp. michiganensis]